MYKHHSTAKEYIYFLLEPWYHMKQPTYLVLGED